VRRFAVEIDGAAMPAIDLADEIVAIGSGASARIRLPAGAARDVHVRIERDRWIAFGAVIVDGEPRVAGDSGELGAGVTFELAGYRVRATRAPIGARASSPQRTASLARELVRGLLGAGSAPGFEREGAGTGDRRELPPPEATLVIGRGDEADWIILDEDLSRAHAEVRRGWDGVTIRDRGSKNGTLVDGVRTTGDGTPLHDGAIVTMGKVRLRFRDPAERHLRGDATPGPAPADLTPALVTPTPPPHERSKAQPIAVAPAAPRPSVIPFAIAAAIAVLALAALAYVLAA
jgi:hypothetical protein